MNARIPPFLRDPAPVRPEPAAGFAAPRFILLGLLLDLGVLAAGGYARERKLDEACRRNLRRLYMALEMYEMDRGALPNLAFFPEEPRTEADSLRVVLEKYGAGGDTCVCPKTHPNHRRLGLTYVWNTKLNGGELHGPGTREWMLTEINGLSGQVPAPHLRHYNILYTDGWVQSSKEPPPTLAEHEAP